MKAIVHRTYGHLESAELPIPAVKDDEVLIRVKAAGVDPGAHHRMTGTPYILRIMGFGLTRPKQPIAGGDVAGIVEKIGAKVTRFAVGDEVFGTSEGSYAEFVVAKEKLLAAKPANVSWEQAAAAPTSAVTALRAVKAAGPGKALVVGAAGGVGTFLVQLHQGEVTAVCSGGKADLVRSLGAARTVDYTKEDLGTGRYDVVYDVFGGRDLRVLRERLTPRGRLILLGGKPVGKLTGLRRSFRAMALNPFVRHQLKVVFAFPTTDDFEELRERLANGTLVPVLDRTYRLTEAKQAFDHVMAGRAKGKSVITP
ncbi:NAD(P)-dependent alcohol dehydrogenase [Herbidospora sp. RD11066]